MRVIDGDRLDEGLKMHRQPTDQKHEADRQWAVGYNAGLDRALHSIAYAPTLTPPKDSTPVQHGRWVKPVPGDGENYCSVCHAVQPWFYGYGYYDSDYCPNCGACMDAKEELKDGKSD